MQTIEIQGRKIPFELRPSRRARRLGLTVYPGGRLVITLPLSSSEDHEAFIRRHEAWILHATSRLAGKRRLPGGVKDYRANRTSALQLVRDRIKHFNAFYKFRVGTVTIRNTRSRWGSCSRRGNLSFSYKIVHLEPEIADYIVIHELCHLKEFNHSPKFWELVSKTAPQYKSLRRILKSFVH